MKEGQFEFTDILSGSFATVSVRNLGPGVDLVVATGDETIAVVLPPDVAADVGRSLLSPPAVEGSVSDITAAVYDVEQQAPADLMDLDERGELDDRALDDRLWMALLGSGVSPETLRSFPEGVRAFYATRTIEWEVANGGFRQAIDNAANCFEEAIAGYRLIGDDASAQLLARALRSTSDLEALAALDEEVDGAPWGGVPWGDSRRIAYVRAHREEFRL
jgi:hypothetical protein